MVKHGILLVGLAVEQSRVGMEAAQWVSPKIAVVVSASDTFLIILFCHGTNLIIFFQSREISVQTQVCHPFILVIEELYEVL